MRNTAIVLALAAAGVFAAVPAFAPLCRSVSSAAVPRSSVLISTRPSARRTDASARNPGGLLNVALDGGRRAELWCRRGDLNPHAR